MAPICTENEHTDLDTILLPSHRKHGATSPIERRAITTLPFINVVASRVLRRRATVSETKLGGACRDDEIRRRVGINGASRGCMCSVLVDGIQIYALKDVYFACNFMSEYDVRCRSLDSKTVKCTHHCWANWSRPYIEEK